MTDDGGFDKELYDKLFGRCEWQPNGCLQYQGSRNNSGYGNLYHRGRNIMAHRAAFDLCCDEIPDGMFVCHACDRPSCVAPSHLWLGTPLDNVRDKIRKGRAKLKRGFRRRF
jgi:hypothetical protein